MWGPACHGAWSSPAPGIWLASVPASHKSSSPGTRADDRGPVRLHGAVDSSDFSDEALMIEVAGGDPAAFEQLFARHAPRLGGALRRGGLSPEDARELLQQTFLIVWRARLDYDPQRPFRPWVTTIALNLKRDALRRERRSPLSPGEGPAYDNAAVEGLQEKCVQAVELHDAVAALPRGSREVVELHWFGGLSMAEVGEAVGASTSAVKVRAHRAYKQLRTALLGGGGA